MSKQHWIWVTRERYYLEPDGSDRRDLEPGAQEGGWWSCAEGTRAGDLVVYYRAGEKRDFAYLVRAETQAFPLKAVETSEPIPWAYGCEYRVLAKLADAVRLEDARAVPSLARSRALRMNLNGSAFRLSASEWSAMRRIITKRNPALERRLERWDRQKVSAPFETEYEIEEALGAQLHRLKDWGYDVQLYSEEDPTRVGRQFRCSAGRIDLLCKYRGRRKRLLVIEIKRGKAQAGVIGQLRSYMEALKQELGVRDIRGLVISEGTAPGFETLFAADRNRIDQIDVADLGLRNV